MPSQINQAISEFHPDIIKATASLPAAASYTGQRRFLTTNNTEYYSDGTRWLSTALFTQPMILSAGYTVNIPAANGATYPDGRGAFQGVYDTWFDKIVYANRHNTTFNSTNYWQVKFFSQNGASVNTQLGATLPFWVTGRIAGNYYTTELSVQAVVTVANLVALFSEYTKVGAPGSLDIQVPTVWFRLIG